MSEQAGLGRLFIPDARDLAFALPPRAAEAAPITKRYWISRGPPLDQGSTSQCVIYSGDKYLTADPIRNRSFGTAAARTGIYRDVQRLDQWPGESPSYEGTSVRALFAYLKAQGVVSEYRWAFDIETCLNHILTTGPVVLGVDWYDGMFAVDRWGYIEPTGRPAGGHAILAIGANRKKVHPLTGEVGAIRLLNSWGSRWAQGGRCWLSAPALGRLLADDGEACCATEIRRPDV